MKKIQDDRFYYKALKLFLSYAFSKYFRTIEIKGQENIPQNQPIIFAANHQCGLIDPLAVIFFQSEPIVYLARADIFKNPLIAKLLFFIKVAPIYRIRDGFSHLSKNEQQMEMAVGVLKDSKCLGVMPEGNHGEHHKLRPLVKGIFRIAFKAEETLEGEKHVYIIPVGLDHSDFEHSGSDLVVTFGKPMCVGDYMESYLENPSIGLSTMKQALSEELSLLMQDVRSTDYTSTYSLSCYGAGAYLEYMSKNELPYGFSTEAGKRFEARSFITHILDEMEKNDSSTYKQLQLLGKDIHQLPATENEITRYLESAPSFKTDVWLFLKTLFFAPILLVNIPSRFITKQFLNTLEDRQMYHTFAYAIGGLSLLLYQIVLAISMGLCFGFHFVQTVIAFFALFIWSIYAERFRSAARIGFQLFPYRFGNKKARLILARKALNQIKQILFATILDKKENR